MIDVNSFLVSSLTAFDITYAWVMVAINCNKLAISQVTREVDKNMIILETDFFC